MLHRTEKRKTFYANHLQTTTFIDIFHFRFEMRLFEVMKYMQQAYVSLEGRLKAEGFKLRVLKILKAWEDAAIYPRDFIHKLHNVFLGVDDDEENDITDDPAIEGIPIEDEDDYEDGIPMDGAALLKGVMKHTKHPQQSPNTYVNADVDGIPRNNFVFFRIPEYLLCFFISF